jgi:hypothetical protein
MEDLENSESNASTITPQGHLKMRFSDFIFYCLTEVSTETQYGFSKLALLYALINNTVFVLYKLADPGTIQLIKSGITLVTALVLWFTLGTRIAKLQWIAIMLQVSAMLYTNCGMTTHSSYSRSAALWSHSIILRLDLLTLLPPTWCSCFRPFSQLWQEFTTRSYARVMEPPCMRTT